MKQESKKIGDTGVPACATIFCSESLNCTDWKACATNIFMVLGVPLEHEWLVPKLRLGTHY